MKSFDKLIDIMTRLRDKDSGCPWDLKQTPSSLKEYILEEAHEVLEAVDSSDPANIKEELGDLLLQIIFMAQIFKEKEVFSIEDVIGSISDKLIRRHPHIFGNGSASTAEEVKQNWEQIKKKEKKKDSIISDYPSSMPSLSVAGRISSQASGVGFDWNSPSLALKKVEEETEELLREIEDGNVDKITEETGDLLFAVANVARLCKVNPEFALNGANRKFTKRFRHVEKLASQNGDKIQDLELNQLEELWCIAKKQDL